MVQTFAVFADGPTTAKVLILVRAPLLYGAPCRVRAKEKAVKVSSETSGGVFAKVCTLRKFSAIRYLT